MFNSYSDKERFEVAIGDYLVLLNLYTNGELAGTAQ